MIVPVYYKRQRKWVDECSNCGDLAIQKKLDELTRVSEHFVTDLIMVCPNGCLDEEQENQ